LSKLAKLMNIKKPNELYNEKGQVNDPEIAKEMAHIEKPYRESRRKFGPFELKPSKKTIQQGEKLAEDHGKLLFEKIENVKNIEALIEKCSVTRVRKNENSYFNFTFKVNGCEIILPSIFLSQDNEVTIQRANEATIDGEKLSKNDLEKIIKKYNDFICKKINEYKENNPTPIKKVLG